MAKTIPPESGGIFGWDVFFQYKNVVISPVLAIFYKKCLKQGKYTHFSQKMSQTGKMLKMHKLYKLQL